MNLSDIVSLVHQGISMSRGFSNINQSKLTERICSYISNLIDPLFRSIIESLGEVQRLFLAKEPLRGIYITLILSGRVAR